MKVGWFGSRQSEGYSPLPLAIREGVMSQLAGRAPGQRGGGCHYGPGSALQLLRPASG